MGLTNGISMGLTSRSDAQLSSVAGRGSRTGRPHPLQWVVEPLIEQPSYYQKAMFGALGCYLYGRLMLVLAARRQAPWQGLLIPTEREHQPSLRSEEPALVVHPVLAKWLYLPESSESFEEAAQRLVDRVLANDPRLGVEPSMGTPQSGKDRQAARRQRRQRR